MALARYWRIKDITLTGSAFDIGDFQFGDGDTPVTGATLSSNISPGGALASFSDGDPTVRCTWTDGEAATLVVTFDFATPVEITQIRQAKFIETDRQMNTCTVENSTDGTTWDAVVTGTTVPQSLDVQTYAAWETISTTVAPTVYEVSGQVLDIAGNPLETMINVYDRATGALISRSTSNPATGNWACVTPNANPVFVVRFNAPVLSDFEVIPAVFGPGTPTANAEIYDNVIPVEAAGGGAPAPI